MFASSPFSLSSPPATISNIGPGTLQTLSVLNFPATQTGTAVNRQIYGSANGVNLNVPTGGNFQVAVNGASQMTLGLGGITNFGGSGSGVAGNIQIISLGGALAYNVPTGGYHSFYIQGVAQLQIGLGGIAALGNGLGTVTAANIQLVSNAANTLTANVPTGGSFVVDVNAVQVASIGAGGLTSRIVKRAPAITQAAQPAINTDLTDVAHVVGLAQAITSMTTNLTGTPNPGDTLRVDITDNGTARGITWGAKFEASTVPLPLLTTAGVRLDVGFVFNSVSNCWRCVAVA